MSVTDTAPVTRAAMGGIDWAEGNHAVCVLDPDGEPIERVMVAHSRAGLGRMVTVLHRHQVQAVGIERPDGPVVDALFEAGITVYVIAPAQVKALRRRYGTAGNKDDRFDAYVLADTVRTDRRRLTPLAARLMRNAAWVTPNGSFSSSGVVRPSAITSSASIPSSLTSWPIASSTSSAG